MSFIRILIQQRWMRPFVEPVKRLLGPNRTLALSHRMGPAETAVVASKAPSEPVARLALWNVDVAMLIPGAGYWLAGWALDPTREIVSLNVSDGRHPAVDLQAIWHRIPRADVNKAHPELSRTISSAGFVALVRIPPTMGTTLSLDVVLDSGKHDYRSIPVISQGEPMAITGNLLAMLPMPHDRLRELLDDHVGPALSALWAHQPRAKPLGDCHWFGTPPAAPKTSLIVPLYGRYDFIRYQLALFADDADLQTGELLYVVDDPSIINPVMALAAGLQPLFNIPFAVIYAGKNLGYAGANNLGARHARGERLLLLNSDVMPRENGWLSRLEAAMDALPDAGVIGPTLVYEDGAIQHAGMASESYLPWEGLTINVHPGKGLPSDRLPNGPQSVEGVTGACMLINRSLYEELEGLDEGFLLGDFEDSDLCHRIARRGLGIYWIPDIVLYHLERQSQNLFADTGWKSKITLYNCWRHERRLQEARA